MSASNSMLTLSPSALLCEQSFLNKRWRVRESDARIVAAIAREHHVPSIIAHMLVARGLSAEEIPHFLNPTLKALLPDPSHLLDMDIAAERLASAIIAKEKIAIYGDYDVDGATSTALLLRFTRTLSAESIYYIPDRIKEGYGPNTQALLGLKEQGVSLVITVDCGTLSFEPIERATNAGLDVIVVDHHQSEARKPMALAIVNPNRLDENSPHRQLAAVGVAFLLAVATTRLLRKDGFFSNHPEPDLISLLDIVALGTICDMVPLTGVNRAFVVQGLKIMANRSNIGLRTLLDVSRIDSKPSTYHTGFVLGPRVNAGGRVGKSDLGARLLSTENEAEALHIAQELQRYNEERKAIEAMMMEEAFVQAAKQADNDIILVGADSWHPGVIGIIAGRLKERYCKPVAAIAFHDGIGKASARSVSGFDFGASVIAAVEAGHLVQGGGHAMAAGFTIEQNKLEAFRQFLTERLKRVHHVLAEAQFLDIDACISVSGANVELAKALEQAGPYGSAHPQPKICVQQAKLIQVDAVGTDHLRLLFTDGGGLPGRLQAMAFRAGNTPLGEQLSAAKGRTLDVVGTLKADEWMGNTKACLHVEDASFSG